MNRSKHVIKGLQIHGFDLYIASFYNTSQANPNCDCIACNTTQLIVRSVIKVKPIYIFGCLHRTLLIDTYSHNETNCDIKAFGARLQAH